MMKKRLKDNPAVKKEILLETEALLLESRTKLEKIRAKLQEIADLHLINKEHLKNKFKNKELKIKKGL
jgi:hypothetical protein